MKIKLKTGKEYQLRRETARKAEVIMNKLKRASSLTPYNEPYNEVPN